MAEEKDLKKIIASNILELRKSNGMTQADLANELNYTPKAISKWERGESIPEIETMVKIAEHFNVTLDYLVTENACEIKEQFIKPEIKKINRYIYMALAVSVIWILATVIFVYVRQNSSFNMPWLAFVWGVPLSALTVGAMSFRHEKKLVLFIIWTVLLWTSLTAFYITFWEYNTALIFIVGLPCQISLILWSKLIKIN